MNELPVADLASESAEVRNKACTAIADAVDAGPPRGEAADAVIAALGHADSGVRQMAQYILQTDAEGAGGAATVAKLRGALTSDVGGVRREAAFLLAGVVARQEKGAEVAALIGNTDSLVRLGTLKALADGARPRAGTEAVVAALANALADDDVNVRKEATWGLYMMGADGAELAGAVTALEGLLDNAATQGNAAIALSFALRMAKEDKRADALYESASGVVQMGAAWGAADVDLRRGDLAAIKTLFKSENDSVRRGLGAFLHHAKQRGKDISLAGQAFNELQSEHPDDALLHARIYGVVQLVEHGPNA
jgi:HEAT repeat protein